MDLVICFLVLFSCPIIKLHKLTAFHHLEIKREERRIEFFLFLLIWIIIFKFFYILCIIHIAPQKKTKIYFLKNFINKKVFFFSHILLAINVKIGFLHCFFLFRFFFVLEMCLIFFSLHIFDIFSFRLLF